MTLNCLCPITIQLMTSTELYRMTETMTKYGGKFVSTMADALRYADPTNRGRILDAFPDLVQRYGPGSAFQQPATVATQQLQEV